MEESRLPLKKWVWAIYLESTSLKGISSMKLHRDIGVRQATAWFILQRIRQGLIPDNVLFNGPVEVDEAYFGGLDKNKHASKKANLGRGPVDKTAVVGMKDRKSNQVTAKVVQNTDGATLNAFVDHHASEDAKVYTDGSCAYKSRKNHEYVKHSVGGYMLNGQAHTNGVESFWAVLKRAYHGVYHHISPKHLQRYVDQFAGKHNLRRLDTIDQMSQIVLGMSGKRLTYKDLVA
ncbi:MAG: IS1595 family transposase [Bacteroidetes bacterium]|nr:IS1595 family transposase [Bacteroidota bacterium]